MGAFLVAGVAHAEDAPSEQAKADARRADARARYEQGVEAYSNGRFKDAVDLFLAADRLSPSAPLSFNIARAYEKLGDDSGALRWYRDYVRRSPNAANLADVNALIATYESRLAKKGVQQLTILSSPSGATILVDQSPVGVTPWTGDLAPGRHVLELRLRGYSDSSSEVDLSAEHAQDVSIRLEPAAALAPQAPAAQPVAPASPPPPRDGGKSDSGGFGIVPYIVMGAGGLVLGGALTFELLRQGAEKDAEKETTQVGYKDKYDTMASRRTTARILTGVGGGLVLVGGALLAVDLMGSKSESAATLTLAPRPGGAEAGLRGSF